MEEVEREGRGGETEGGGVERDRGGGGVMERNRWMERVERQTDNEGGGGERRRQRGGGVERGVGWRETLREGVGV